jgi:hypothetical protein
MKIYMKLLLSIIIISFVSLAQTGIPKVFSIDGNKIYSYRQSYLKGDLKKDEIVKKIIREANKRLDMDPVSVMEKEVTPPGGSKHDYTSLGKYWWPNPKTKDGLPYIRKDGVVNPETKNISDDENFGNLVKAVGSLTLGYYITNETKYSDKAAQLLRVWFLDEKTKMNPNLNYSQFIPGKSEGRGTGIIDTHWFALIVDDISLLETSKSWTNEDDSNFKLWLNQYLDWLINSKNGKDESNAKNNHGSWYDVQVVSIALFLDKIDLAKKYLEDVKTKRISVQIEDDGKQPLELVRTTSWQYSVFNLEALIKLAIIGDKVGVDLWNYVGKDGGSIRKALDYVLPFALDIKAWKSEQIKDIKTSSLHPLLIAAKRNIDNKIYSDWITKIFGEKMIKDQENILY